MVDAQDVPDTDQAAVKSIPTPTPAEAFKGRVAECVAILQRGVRSKDTKLLNSRLLRQTALIRGDLHPGTIKQIVSCTLTESSKVRQYVEKTMEKLDTNMEVDSNAAALQLPAIDQDAAPEMEAYAHLLVIMYCVDHQLYDEAKDVCAESITHLHSFNRRTLDGIAAKVYFYFSLVYERTNSLAQIRGQLLGLHRTAVINHNELGQETALNLLLRNYLHYSLFDQAESFRSKAQKSDVWRSSQQVCRYLFYVGKIRAVQLDYTDAKDFLAQALRKAPVVATGFQVIVLKWLTVVRLLLGEIPDHSEFKQPSLEKPLRPYFSLAQAVRVGDLAAFSNVAEGHEECFRVDGTYHLITRLRHNVIRAGLRRINLAYSRISIADIARKLNLQSGEDAESILAKAIRDGGIEAVIDHENKWMISRQQVDVYTTSAPQEAYHARIAFCLDIHNEAVKAMQFEGEDAKKKLASIESNRERALLDEELAQQLLDDDEDDDDYL